MKDSLLSPGALKESFMASAGGFRAGDPQDSAQLEEQVLRFGLEGDVAHFVEWNATLIEGEVVQAVPVLKEKHAGNLIVSGCVELAVTLAREGLVDEFWFWVNPHLWPAGPRILDGVGPSASISSRPRLIDAESSGCATGRPEPEGDLVYRAGLG